MLIARENTMKRTFTVVAALLLSCSALFAASSEPLQLLNRYEMPASVKGRFDHLGVDLKGNRLFAAAETAHSVLVFDLRSGAYLREIAGIRIPHAIFVREDLNRIYITDGGEGAVKVYDGSTYELLKSIPLKVDADSIAFDPGTKYLYVINGGGDAHESASTYSVIDTTNGAKLADVKIDGDTLEASALDSSSPRIFINNPAKNEVEVFDRAKRAVEASWPIHLAKDN